jgi:hypothetical protein
MVQGAESIKRINMNKCWSVEYEHNGKLYSMHLTGTEKEILTHADNLGCDSVNELVGVIPYDGLLEVAGKDNSTLQ